MSVWSAAQIRQVLSENNIAPNKALGQNFLIDPQAVEQILSALGGRCQSLLEIGPGLGALTEGLCKRADHVVAVEKDAMMVRLLSERLKEEKRLLILHQDFLEVDLGRLEGEAPWAVAGNLPYYVTTPIVIKLLCTSLPISHMVLMLQKEAAQRFFAKPGDKNYTPLTVLSQLGYEARTLCTLSPHSYWPQPEVDSAVVCLKARGQAHPVGFEPFLQAAFSMRRKTLANNLSSLGTERAVTQQVLQELGLKSDARAESLTPQQLLAVYHAVESEKDGKNPDKV